MNSVKKVVPLHNFGGEIENLVNNLISAELERTELQLKKLKLL